MMQDDAKEYPMSLDLRKNSRVSCSIPALFRFPGEEPAESWGIVYDLSLGGAKVETRRSLRIGETVYVTFAVGEMLKFENIRTRVVWIVQKKGYFLAGVEFDATVDRNYLFEAIKYIIGTGPKG